ncbi:MAG: hypothetical protein Kow00117_22040 [Phototrophicales bacterium]
MLDVAEELFSTYGYATVKLKDIAKALGMRQASLYYHAPGGKEELYLEVMRRNMQRHRQGLEEAIAQADDWQSQLQAVAYWFLSQPPMDFTRMIHSDLRAVHPDQAQHLIRITYEAVLQPIEQIFEQCQAVGDIRAVDIKLLTGAFLSLIQAVHSVPQQWTNRSKEEMADEVLDILLHGLTAQKANKSIS